MSGNTTTITDPSSSAGDGDSAKTFSFDYSYWSHDGFTEQEEGYLAPSNSKYADQVVLKACSYLLLVVLLLLLLLLLLSCKGNCSSIELPY